MMLMLVGSVALVFVYEALDPDRAAAARSAIEYVDLGLVVFFLLEWGWRVRRSHPGSGAYALRHAWELLGMVPLLLPLPAFLRALRLVRLVRILRVFETVGKRLGVWQRIAHESHLKSVGIASGMITVVGATLVWLMERDSNPAFVSLSESIWWAIVTVTTVGYGDITPITPTGRFIAAGLMVTGIGTIGLLASTLASALVTSRAQADERAEEQADEPAAGATTGGETGLVSQLEVLGRLRQDGLLDEDEFRRAKERLLG